MDNKNSSIDTIVGQLKSGDMSKAQLFGELSKLYDVEAKEEEEEEEEPENKVSSPIESTIDKRQKIEDLLSTFRAEMDNDLFGNEQSVGLENSFVEDQYQESEDLDVDSIQESTERVLKHLKDSMNSDANFAENPSFPATPKEEREMYYQEDADSIQNSSYAPSPREGRTTRSSILASTGPRSRAARIKQLQTVMRMNQEMECTFKPEIKALPSMYVSRNTGSQPLVDRLYAWNSKKKRNRSLKSLMSRKNERENCTFQPSLNETSKLLSSQSRQDIRNVSLRSQARAKVVEREIRRQMEQEHMDHCTFKPKINENSRRMLRGRGRNSDSYSHNSKEASMARALSDSMRECTFKPQVNPVKKTMQAANLYLEMKAHERLSQPHQKYSNEEAWPEEYGEGNSYRSVSKASSPKRTGKKKAPLRSPAFLERGRKHLERKKLTVQRHLEQEQKELYKPRLNKKSVKIVRNNFFERLKEDTNKRSLNREKLHSRISDEQNYSFAPEINTMSKNLRGRTVLEMSDGDVALMTSKRELARMYARKKELSEATFKPKRKTKGGRWDNIGTSTLKISSDPHNYGERMKEKAMQREEWLEAMRAERESEELGSCSFAPETKELPDFIARIAESARASKANKPKKVMKPGWK